MKIKRIKTASLATFFALYFSVSNAATEDVSYVHETCTGDSKYNLGVNCFTSLADWEAILVYPPLSSEHQTKKTT